MGGASTLSPWSSDTSSCVRRWFSCGSGPRAATRGGQFRAMAWWTAVVQLLWVATCFVDHRFSHRLWIAVILIWLEVAAPLLFVWRGRRRVLFHPRHIAERHGLLVIISLGEIVVGTAVSVRTLHELHGWWQGAASVLVCGVSLALSMWWLYFGLPLGEALHRRRELAPLLES
ncbi:hypothetical protein EII35_05015 [Arachnia propionica]|uniref:Uncharacterized protein n=1 Tax=Arachnia propionica TaxID=1750 RepID=A0A3P1WX41_9ACTN|nr:hypothetical protein EII35_05015 [Arachnia propionica]